MQDLVATIRKPSIEFDGDLVISGDRTAPCAVQIWFTGNSYDPITIRVQGPQIRGLIARPTRIVSRPGLYCSAGCHVRLEGVWARSWKEHSYPARRQLQHVIELADVRRLVLTNLPDDGSTSKEKRRNDRFMVKLSESTYLSPTCWPAFNNKGTVKFEHRHHLKTRHPSLGTVRFERYYSFSPLQAQDVHLSSELVAVVGRALRGESSIIDAASTAEVFEDLCLLTSVASRHRVRVRGWKHESAGVFENTYLDPLKSGVGLPELDEHDFLIPREHASDFLRHCAKTWSSFSEDELRKLRCACYALAPIYKPTIEGQFMAMFPALEGLASIFRRRQGKEFVYSKSATWRHVRKKLSEAVDSIAVDDPFFNPEAIKRNLSALERVPFAESTRSVLTELGAWSDNLWPLFGSEGSLASIRHLLAHGEQLDPKKMGAVLLAKSQLKILLERTFCRALDWPLAATSVSDAAIIDQGHRFAREIEAGRSALSGTRPSEDNSEWMPVKL